MDYWNEISRRRLMSRRRALVLAGSGLTGAALLAACGGDDEGTATTSPTTSAGESQTSAGESQTSAGEAQRGGFYVAESNGVKNWNPITNNNDAGSISGAHAYDRLVSSKTDERQFVLEAAESVETPDPLTAIFKLHPGMVFHDREPVNGRALKAEDIVKSQTYVLELPNAFNNSFQRSFVESVEAPDDTTVIFHLQRPDAYLYSTNHMGAPGGGIIFPQEMLDLLDDHVPVGSGPYEWADGEFNSRYHFKRFDKFRGASAGLPYIDDKEVRILTDTVALEAAIKGGELSSWRLPPASIVDALVADSDGKLTIGQRSGVRGIDLFLNMSPQAVDLPWRTDQRVREAFYRFSDGEEMLQLVQRGKGATSPGPIPNGLDAYQLDPSESAKYIGFDLQAAKQLLDAASFDYDREWEILMTSTATGGELPGQVWQNQAAKVGVNFKVVSLPFAQWLQDRIVPANYETLIVIDPGDDTPALFMRFHHSDQQSQFTHFGLFDPEVDALVEKSESTVDFAENINIVKQIQSLVLSKYSSVMFFFTPDHYDVYDSRLQGWELIPQSAAKYRTELWFKES